MFGDLRRHDFDLESTLLHHFMRLSRLLLEVILPHVIHDDLRHWVGHKDR